MSDSTDEFNAKPSDELAAVERRDEGRVRVAAEVTTQSISNFTALGTDLSVGGIYIVTPHQLREGATIDLEFSVEDIEGSFEVVGEVKWTREQPVGGQVWWGHGIQFHGLDDRALERLDAFVSDRKPLEDLGSLPVLDDA